MLKMSTIIDITLFNKISPLTIFFSALFKFKFANKDLFHIQTIRKSQATSCYWNDPR